MNLLIVFFSTFLIAYVILSIITKPTLDGSIGKRKNTRNFKVRFDAAAEKYYIVNEFQSHDEAVVNWVGKRIMYKEKLKAEFVTEKLNA